jgi:uncharacterized membrane protein YccC
MLPAPSGPLKHAGIALVSSKPMNAHRLDPIQTAHSIRQWLDWLLKLLGEELAPRPNRFKTSLRMAVIATAAIAVMTACHISNPLGPYLAWLMLGPVAMMPLSKAALYSAIEAVTLAVATVIALLLADTPWIMLPFIGAFTTLSTYIIARRKLGSFGLLLQVVTLDTLYGVIFAPNNVGWSASSLFGGSIIAFATIAVFDSWLWPHPAEKLLLESLTASSLRLRSRLLAAMNYYLGEYPAERPPEPPISSEMQVQLGLLERARTEGISPHRRAVLLAAISRGARLHGEIDRLIIASREAIARNIPIGVASEMRSATAALGTALAEMAGEMPALIRTGPDEPPPPMAARIAPAIAAMDARIVAERTQYIRRADPAEVANLGAVTACLHDMADILGRPLDEPPLTDTAKSVSTAAHLDATVLRYSAKVALCMVIGYVVGLATQQPAMTVILTTVIITALPTYGASMRKMILRIVGTVIGGIVSVIAIIIVTPNFSTLPSYMIVLSVVLFASAYASLGSGRVSYAGKSIGTTFVLVFAGLTPSIAIYDPLWRIWGIFLGTLIVTVVFFIFWPEYAGDSLLPRLRQAIAATLALLPGGRANNVAAIRDTSHEITNVLVEILEIADDARLEGRKSLINHDAVVESAGIGRRIAHRLAALAIQRLEHPLPLLDAETEAARDAVFMEIRRRLEAWLAFYEGPRCFNPSASLALAASHQPQALIEPLEIFSRRLSEAGFARINSWSLDQRRQLLAELQSLHRLQVLMTNLDAYLAVIPGTATTIMAVTSLRPATA